MPVKYGIIGCGAIGQRRHIPECAANPDAKLVALVDPVKDRVQALAKQYGAQAFTDYKEMLKKADIDAVVIGTPNATHAPMTIAAFKAGKHVLVEKPMATTRAEAKAMIKAAEKAGKYLMVGQNQRLSPPHVKAKEILKSGRLGKVLAFRTSFKHPGPDGWSVDGAKSWFLKKAPAVLGVTGDLGIHKADLMRWLLDQEFVQVSGFVETLDKRTPDGKMIALDDNAYLTLKTNKGIIGSLEISWTNYGGEDNQTVIYGQHGTMFLGVDRDYPVMIIYRNGNRECHKVGAIATNTHQTGSGMVDAFTTSILRKRAPEISGLEGYKSLDVILTGMEAARSGKTLRIKHN